MFAYLVAYRKHGRLCVRHVMVRPAGVEPASHRLDDGRPVVGLQAHLNGYRLDCQLPRMGELSSLPTASTEPFSVAIVIFREGFPISPLT